MVGDENNNKGNELPAENNKPKSYADAVKRNLPEKTNEDNENDSAAIQDIPSTTVQDSNIKAGISAMTFDLETDDEDFIRRRLQETGLEGQQLENMLKVILANKKNYNDEKEDKINQAKQKFKEAITKDLKDYRDNLQKVKEEKSYGDAGQEDLLNDEKEGRADEDKIRFSNEKGEDIEIEADTDEDSKIPDQLRALKKSIIKELNNGDESEESTDAEMAKKLDGLKNIKLQIMDENGNVHDGTGMGIDSLKSLPQSILGEIKKALLLSVSNEKAEKGQQAENEYGDLESGYSEEADLFEGSGSLSQEENPLNLELLGLGL